MATAFPEITSVTAESEEETNETNEKTVENVASPESYVKHPLQNRLYNHIQLSSNLTSGCDYSLFKDDIEPMWEDERNRRGGRWLITLSKQQRKSDLDRFWLETLLCLVGEAFDDHSDDVCGAVINVRAKGDKIAIWTTNYENKEAITHIGRVYKERLGIPPKVVIGYQSHADTATKSGSTTKKKFLA
ncbi:eukaryotic translation initiation factor 4E-1A isoform X2 [Nerophis ophidion]|uniref:eukaryotic translation initiation factor 4E-1A isoform X2 n=1 Tax=Nerophis ophidion TaxID=159077 RepID=UPI002AE0A3E9|nr:eukaryotic translation initiation factor 4E-1A isoform X2 [Nerophis ophidion]